jgi:hypothetical protein
MSNRQIQTHRRTISCFVVGNEAAQTSAVGENQIRVGPGYQVPRDVDVRVFGNSFAGRGPRRLREHDPIEAVKGRHVSNARIDIIQVRFCQKFYQKGMNGGQNPSPPLPSPSPGGGGEGSGGEGAVLSE